MFLKVSGQNPVLLNKPLSVAGSGASFDIPVGCEGNSALFTLEKTDKEVFLLPLGEKIWVNGKAVGHRSKLNDSDRIEWKTGSAVFHEVWDTDEEKGERDIFALKCLGVLETLSEGFDGNLALKDLLHGLLENLVKLAGAEKGYLTTEWRDQKGWELVASVGPEGALLTKQALLSNTILNEAVKTRKPVYLESIVGHPWENKASLLGAKVFSICCLPLLIGERVFGCVYLSTTTTGKTIRKEGLKELQILATQIALLLGCEFDRQRTEAENIALRQRGLSKPKTVFYEPQGKLAAVMERLDRLAPTELNLLVLGETGTGKELMARAIHDKSNRRKGPFVAINCGSLPASLVESLLFGYAKGAFTGATKDTSGKIQEADQGTLFLDEIAELPLELQVKLLRVLQEKVIEPIGSSKQIKVDFRVVAATHQNLEAKVREGKFRQDLFYRLNGASLTLIPLRERGEEVILLASHFLQRAHPDLYLSKAAQERLLAHKWPGNVRELEQVIGRAAALAMTSEVGPEDLELSTSQFSNNEDSATFDGRSLKEAQLAFTESYVRKALDQCNGNRSQAAAFLGISERTLYRWISGGVSDSDGRVV